MLTFAGYAVPSPVPSLLWVAEARRTPPPPARLRGLWEAVESVTAADPATAALTRDIRRRERALKCAASPVAWSRYVALEESVARRSLRALELAAAWGYTQGSRKRRSR